MSRLGKQPVAIPSGVEVKLSGSTLTVKGKGGELKQTFNTEIDIKVDDGQVTVTRPSDSKKHKALHGLTRVLIANMVTGVTEGFKKELEIVGVGWNAKLQGKKLVLQIGFCHTVDFEVPAGLEVKLASPQKIEVSGIDKQQVGQFAADIRKVRKPEPYKGKGIRYLGEYVIRKEGKAQAGK